jgi:hypothetical protein
MSDVDGVEVKFSPPEDLHAGDIVLVVKKKSDRVYDAVVIGVLPKHFVGERSELWNQVIVKPTLFRWIRRRRVVDRRKISCIVSREIAELERMVGA